MPMHVSAGWTVLAHALELHMVGFWRVGYKKVANVAEEQVVVVTHGNTPIVVNFPSQAYLS